MLTKLYVKADVALRSFVKDRQGVTAIEYAIIGVAIAGTVTVVFGGSGGFKDALDSAMGSLKTAVTTGTTTTGGGSGGTTTNP